MLVLFFIHHVLVSVPRFLSTFQLIYQSFSQSTNLVI